MFMVENVKAPQVQIQITQKQVHI